MKQKIFTLLLTCMVCAGTLNAAATKVGDLYYNLNPYNGVAKVTYENLSNNYPEMTSVVIPATFTYDSVLYTVTSLYDMCFQNCKKLTSVTIPNTVTEIEFFAFEGCTALQSISIPASVTKFGMGAFQGCSALASITVDAANTKYSSPRGSNAIIETAANKLVIGCKTTVIPDSVTVIGESAFHSNLGLTSITIPAGVTSIESQAFAFCDNLTSITCLATTPPTVGSSCFLYVPKTIPVSVPQGSLQSYIGAEGWDYFDVFAVPEEPEPDPECTGEPQTSGVCGDHLTYEVDCNNVFHVYGYGDMYDFDSATISAQSAAIWKAFRPVIKRIELPGGLTSIGANTFTSFSKIKSVDIPDSVTLIGYAAFGSCTELESVKLPASLKTLGGMVFSSNDKLKSLAIPATTDSIGFGVTHTCRSLVNVTVAEGNPRYDSRNNCNAIIETATDKLIAGCNATVIPADVKHIDWLAFSSSDIKSVTLPEGLLTLGEYAFEYCNNLDSIVIPASVTYVDCEAFNGNSLKYIAVDPANARYDSRDNCNAIIETATNNLVIGCQNSVIPEGIVSISSWAFEAERGLKKITLPSTLQSMGHGTFYACRYLEQLTCYAPVPPSIVADSPDQSLVSYPYSTFYHVPNGIPVYVPEESIELYRNDPGWSRFTNIKAIGDEEPEYELPACIKESGDCGANLHWAITCGEDSLIIYGKGAMLHYNSLDNAAPWSSYKYKIRNIVFQDGISSIGKYAFYGITNLRSIVIPEGVTAIEENAFFFCSGLESISLPNSLHILGNSALGYCGKLTSLVIPAAVDTLDGSATTGCNNLVSLVVKPANKKYDSRDNCNAIIETKTNTLFRGCKNTIIPDDITTIGYYGFMSMDSLRTITLPAGTTLLEGFAFYNCKNLTSLTSLALNPPTIRYANYTFQNVPDSLIVYVPAAALAAYQAADIWKQFDIRSLTNMYNVKALANHGVVRGTGTYESGTTLELTAVPDAGFQFSQWSDGTTDNPKTFVVTQDTILRALFYTPEVEQEVVITSLKANEMHITWETVDAATIYIVKLYKNGALIATYNVDDKGHILDYALASPERIRARRCRAEDMPLNTLGIDFTGLNIGDEYTYRIDAYDEAENIVGAQSGSFTAVEPDPVATDVDALEDDELAPRKLIRDGQLLIIRQGKIYNATGVNVE